MENTFTIVDRIAFSAIDSLNPESVPALLYTTTLTWLSFENELSRILSRTDCAPVKSRLLSLETIITTEGGAKFIRDSAPAVLNFVLKGSIGDLEHLQKESPSVMSYYSAQNSALPPGMNSDRITVILDLLIHGLAPALLIVEMAKRNDAELGQKYSQRFQQLHGHYNQRN